MDRVFGWLAEYSYACVAVSAAIDATAFPFQDVWSCWPPACSPPPAERNSSARSRSASQARWPATICGTSGAAGSRALRAFHRWLTRRGRRSVTDPAEYLRRHGGLAIFIGRFIATIRVLVWPMASAHGISYGRFLVWDLGEFCGTRLLLARPPLAEGRASA